MAVKSTMTIDFQSTRTDQTAALLSAVHQMSINETRADGTGTDAVDAVYSNLALSLAASATELDLTSLTDSFGDSLSFQKIFWLAIKNTDSSNELIVGAATAEIWEPFVETTGDAVIVPANGWFIWGNTTGATVDGTNKTLKLDPASNTIAIEIMFIGTKT